jgi:hypothetical protein
MSSHEHCACPGSAMMDLRGPATAVEDAPTGPVPSQLRQWPIQMHLISPAAPYFQGADLLLAADCTAFALGSFHNDQLKGKSLAIACPKLDDGRDIYIEKIRALVDEARINTLTVAIMQVPCCRGLVTLVNEALAKATRKVPVKVIVVSIQGEILSEDWL